MTLKPSNLTTWWLSCVLFFPKMSQLCLTSSPFDTLYTFCASLNLLTDHFPVSSHVFRFLLKISAFDIGMWSTKFQIRHSTVFLFCFVILNFSLISSTCSKFVIFQLSKSLEFAVSWHPYFHRVSLFPWGSSRNYFHEILLFQIHCGMISLFFSKLLKLLQHFHCPVASIFTHSKSAFANFNERRRYIRELPNFHR